MSKVLEGIRIIDFSKGYMAGYATMLLADFGAEVIKIELPEGDSMRTLQPKNEDGSAYNAYVNRGKKSVCIDYTGEEGRELVLKLLKTADVVCENFAADELESYGLGYDQIKKVNEKVIYASLTAFGKTGPLSHIMGTDILAQALSGLMAITGFPESIPTAHGSRMGEQYGGVFLAYAIMLALIVKEREGIGQKIDISATDCLFTALEAGEITCSLTGKNFKREGNPSQSIAPYDTFKAKDGYISTAVSTNAQWEKFCEAMEMQDVLEDPRFATNELRGKNYIGGLRDIISDKFSTMTKFDIEKILRPYNIPCGPVLTAKEAVENDQLNIRNMIVEVEDKAVGTIKMPGMPIKMSEVDDLTFESAPLLGQHTEEYLGEDAEEIAE